MQAHSHFLQGRHCLSYQGWSMHRHPSKDSQNKRQSESLLKTCGDLRYPHEELYPPEMSFKLKLSINEVGMNKIKRMIFYFYPKIVYSSSHLKKVMLESIINVLSWLIPQIQGLNTAGVLVHLCLCFNCLWLWCLRSALAFSRLCLSDCLLITSSSLLGSKGLLCFCPQLF